MTQRVDGGPWRAIFDAFPAWMFLVDEDVRILACNSAAAELLAPGSEHAIGVRGGEILHCIHSRESAQGCGRAPFCADCTIRRGVRECFATGKVTRQRGRMRLYNGAQIDEIFLLVTVAPVQVEGRAMAVLALEDISELTELERIIPICSCCRKVRRESSEWEPIEAHFRERLEIEFTHGLCPECLSGYMRELRGEPSS